MAPPDPAAEIAALRERVESAEKVIAGFGNTLDYVNLRTQHYCNCGDYSGADRPTCSRCGGVTRVSPYWGKLIDPFAEVSLLRARIAELEASRARLAAVEIAMAEWCAAVTDHEVITSDCCRDHITPAWKRVDAARAAITPADLASVSQPAGPETQPAAPSRDVLLARIGAAYQCIGAADTDGLDEGDVVRLMDALVASASDGEVSPEYEAEIDRLLPIRCADPAPAADVRAADAILDAKIDGGRLLISIGVDTLGYAFAHGEYAYRLDGELVITDAEMFAGEVCRELCQEGDRDGSTMISRMLDRACETALENGAEGVDVFTGLGRRLIERGEKPDAS